MDKMAKMKRAIRINIRACEALLDFYEGNDAVQFTPSSDRSFRYVETHCPLCAAGSHISAEISDRHEGLILRCDDFEAASGVPYCYTCPWTRFMGRTCFNFVKNDPRFAHVEEQDDGITDPGQLKAELDGEWVDMRIEQLKCWIAEMKRMCEEPGGLEDYFNATS